MLIYIFAEHYPTPYKPQFDTEFAFFLRQGHEIKIFVGGQYTSTVHPRVRSYGLDKMTFLFPTTLKTLPRFLGTLLARLIRFPLQSFQLICTIYDSKNSVKKNFMRAARMLLLPEAPPDLCYIHNIATAECIDFLHQLYPTSRVVLYFHGGEVGGVQRVYRDYHLFKLMHVVFSNTNFSRNQAIDRGCPPDRAITLPVGFDLSDYPCSSEKRYRKDGLLRMISVGRLSEEKGLVFALEAISKLVAAGHREIRYTIVGRGIQEIFLKDFVNSNGLNNYVEFVGEQDKAGVVAHLDQSDVLILPSIVTDTWAETQAAVVQEAMFMRLLVVTTKAGGVPESTAEIMRQFSVPVCDASAIAAMIRKILTLSESEMARLSEAAWKFTVDRYNIDLIGFQLLKYAMSGKVESATQ
jgi:colanic acid/amylovoran biosynthesis glycosyltransferase